MIDKGDAPRYPDRCTGIVSPRCLQEAGVGAEVVLREVRGGLIHAPGGRCLHIEAGDTRGVVIDRHLFQQRLLEMAEGEGVEYLPRACAVGMGEEGLLIERQGNLYRAKGGVVIGADGPRSSLAAWSGLPPPGEILIGLQAICRSGKVEGETVEVYIDQDLAPGFFAWVVPAEEGVVRVGLATPEVQRVASRLKGFLDMLKLRPLKVHGGLIPIGPRERTIANGVMVVGDAAAQAKPTSGGGLFTGIVAAKIAGRVAGSLSAPDRGGLWAYEQGWRKRLERELSFGMAVRRLFKGLSNRQIARIFDILDNEVLLEVVALHGDIDYPSRIVKALLREPKQWWRIFRGFGAVKRFFEGPGG